MYLYEKIAIKRIKSKLLILNIEKNRNNYQGSSGKIRDVILDDSSPSFGGGAGKVKFSALTCWLDCARAIYFKLT